MVRLLSSVEYIQLRPEADPWSGAPCMASPDNVKLCFESLTKVKHSSFLSESSYDEEKKVL
jgi:hypothetical protein